ncbi:MAG: nitroreductase family protein, partial [Pseudomonadota bacterium]|nr:nitroreductase family protein [Pseudomonadota bacterium]
HLQIAPWLIVIFAERYGQFDDGTRYKNYYVTESVGIAAGFLISALHTAGLAFLTHTPNPMGFLTKICRRPPSNKPLMTLAIGHPAADATIPAAAKIKKPLDQVMTVVD